jgi:hypothetical protein
MLSSRKAQGGKCPSALRLLLERTRKGQSVVVTIDGHETVLTFQSKDDAEKFARLQQARLAEDEKNVSQRVREIAYRLWQEEGCPKGEDLRHWFAAKALFDAEKAEHK